MGGSQNQTFVSLSTKCHIVFLVLKESSYEKNYPCIQDFSGADSPLATLQCPTLLCESKQTKIWCWNFQIWVFYIHIYLKKKKKSFFLSVSSSFHLFEIFFNPASVVYVLAWNIFSCFFIKWTFTTEGYFTSFAFWCLLSKKVFKLQYWILITAIAASNSRMHSLFVHVCVYINIYTHTHLCADPPPQTLENVFSWQHLKSLLTFL